MQDVFEPMSFAGEVFEPTANFSGEAFEPMNFDGEYSNFGDVDPNVIAQAVGGVVQGVGAITQSKALKEASKSEERKFIDSVCGSRTSFALKSKREANQKCRQNALNTFLKESDKKSQEQGRQFDLEKEKIALQKSMLNTPNNKSKSNKGLVIGLSIGGGLLVVGAILFFALRKRK